MSNFIQKSIFLGGPRWEIDHIREFIRFIRPKICLFITGIAASGYLLFNPISSKLIFVILSSFFGSAGAYSINLMTDKEEDLINNKKLNYFVLNNIGWIFAFSFIVFGILFCSFLSKMSVFFYFLSAFLGAVYSFFKFKKITLFKNLYAGFVIPIMFLLGAVANSIISINILSYYLLISLYIFTISLLSDLRDYEGDRALDIRTLPVVLGKEIAGKIVYGLLILFTLSVIMLEAVGLFPFLPFVALFALFLRRGDPHRAHVSQMMSFVVFPIAAYMLTTLGGI